MGIKRLTGNLPKQIEGWGRGIFWGDSIIRTPNAAFNKGVEGEKLLFYFMVLNYLIDFL
jgi:hypothetical protein